MELKSCPFCGEEATIGNFLASEGTMRYVMCKECSASTKVGITMEEAIENWNCRYEPPNPPLTLDELRGMDGEPVYCVSIITPDRTGWGIMCAREKAPYIRTHIDKGRLTTFFYLDTLGVEWLAYRRRPEEVPK